VVDEGEGKRERGRDGEKRGKGMERRRCKGEDERTPPTGACFQRARGKPARKEDKCCSTCDAVNTATVLPPQMGFFQLFASLWLARSLDLLSTPTPRHRHPRLHPRPMTTAARYVIRPCSAHWSFGLDDTGRNRTDAKPTDQMQPSMISPDQHSIPPVARVAKHLHVSTVHAISLLIQN